MTHIDTAVNLIRSGDTDGFRELLDQNPELAGAKDAQGVSLLMQAVYNRRTDLAGMVADRLEQLDIFSAVSLGRVEAVKALLAEDPSLADAVAPDGFAPLHLASFFVGEAVMTCLLEAGARVDIQAQNPMKVFPLNSAVASGRLECVEALLAAGADVNAPQQQNITPLMSAAAGGHEAVLRLLLERGADKTTQSDDGHTAADYARELGHEHLADLLETSA
ncbi:MAG: ankyrin repeat domain-containing protein [Acidobacteriota bacterium]|nr:ankyrin repeat domain-containing protein [Acidobacteriota bacterium]